MKNHLIALAALCAAGTVSAQTSVTLFGVLDLGFERVKTNAGQISGLAPSANSSNRIGFRGTEDLGSGFSAGFWLEGAFNPATGAGLSGTNTRNQGPTDVPAGGLMFNRRATVSLSGQFGELRVGRDYTPTYSNYGAYDAFGANSVGASLANFTGNGFASTFMRSSNSVGYFLPANLGGVYGQAMYAFGNRPSTQTQAVAAAYGASPVNTESNGRNTSARIGYAGGPLNTSVSYGRTTYAPGTNPISFGGFASTSGNVTDLSWGGSYTFATVKAMALLSRQKGEDVGAPGVSRTVDGFALGADVGVGAGDVLASYSTAKIKELGARGKKLAFGYVHNLSRRTALYGMVARVSNSGGSSFDAASYSAGSLGSIGGAANVNGHSTGIDFGLRHSF